MRILVRRHFAAGDVLLATPVLSAIKRSWPLAGIDVETMCPDVLAGNPDVVFAGPPPAFRWRGTHDRVFDLNLAYERRPKVHPVLAYAEECGVEASDLRPRIHAPEQERARARAELSGGRWAAFHIGPTAWPGRNWPAARFNEVARALRGFGWSILGVGSSRPAGLSVDRDLFGVTTAAGLAAWIGACGLFVGIDSFPMHVAVAMRTPVAAVFGAIDPALRLPGSPDARGVRAPEHLVWCLGCHHELPAPRTHTGCLRDRVHCMELIDPDKVVSEALEAAKWRAD